jgi:hypothetical protein
MADIKAPKPVLKVGGKAKTRLGAEVVVRAIEDDWTLCLDGSSISPYHDSDLTPLEDGQ